MASQRSTAVYGPKSKKFFIFVEESPSYAYVTVDWFETSRDKCETKWSYDSKNCVNIVQFPVPTRNKNNEVVMQTGLENLMKDVQKKGFKSLKFEKFGSWIMKIFVPILWNAACSTDVDLNIVLCPNPSQITETKEILQSLESKGDDAGTKLDKILMPVKKATFHLLHFFQDTFVNEVKKKGCSVSYDSGNLAISGSKAKECEKIIKKALEVTNNKLSVDTIDNVSQNDSALLSKIQYLKDNKDVLCVFDEDGGLKIYGLTEDSVKNARREIEKSMRPKSTNINTAPSSGSTGSHSKVNTVRSQSSALLSSLSTKNNRTFYTKEMIKVHVYVGNILDLDVDCIVNPTDKDLLHQGAIAREIAKRAGDDLKKDCRTYLGEYQQLDVGRACRTSAGRMKYKYVIHTVGPRWKDFQPITEQSLDECGRLLKTAILESLGAANIAPKTMKSIAFPAISAGQLGVPKDFCCVQYVKAVIDYSKTTTSKMEIHFVDLSADMIKMLGETFDSMIYCDKPPTFYNKKAYISTNVTGNKDGSKANVASSNGSSNVMYPYCTYMKPPRSYREEFTCCLGPKQNVFVYTGNVLDIPKVDMIVCGDKVNSNTSGMLATLLLDKCGPKYKSNKAEAFKGKSEGDVVVCATEKYRYVAHMCLIPKKNVDPDKRPLRVNHMFETVFEEMKVRECRTLALPLIGTGKAHGDPEFYAERFIDSLLQFSFNNKSFEFNIHLVNFEQAKTDTTIKIIFTMVDKEPKYAPILPCKPTDYNRIIESPVKRPISAHDQGNQRHHTSNHKYKDGDTTRNHSNKSKSSSEDKRKSKYHESNLDMSDHSSSTKKASRTRKPNAGKRQEERKSSTDTNNHNSYPRNDDNFSDDDENPVRNDYVSKNSKLMQDTSKKKETSRASPTELVSSMKLSVKAKTNEMPGNLRIFCGEADGQNDTVAETDSHRMNVSVAENENSALDSDGEDDYDIGDGDDDDYDDDTGDGGDKDNCDHYHASRTHDSNDDDSDQDDDYMTKHPEPEETLEDCVICMDTIEVNDIKELACGHKFHADCIDQQFAYKEACPTCGYVCGIITGDQPEGCMDVNINRGATCAGYEEYERIEITYSFPGGRQADCHPEPGKFYKGIKRTAYLPYNKQGREILEMLKVAFERKVIFTIGRSRTTGADSVITWNDIHHKTDHRPNTQFGYPDPTYLDRVTDELKAKGVTVDDIPKSKKHKRR
ncbi:hypothetical protein ACF0H5_009700 [Mactra antiquata]